jgi:hypothetical protein
MLLLLAVALKLGQAVIGMLGPRHMRSPSVARYFTIKVARYQTIS